MKTTHNKTHKAMKVYPNSSLTEIGNVSHSVFKYVEKRFNDWFDRAPKWVREQYTGYADEPGCYTKRGAIEQAIENAIEYADEIMKPVELSSFDLECAFE